jgi:hypothetical protein
VRVADYVTVIVFDAVDAVFAALPAYFAVTV